PFRLHMDDLRHRTFASFWNSFVNQNRQIRLSMLRRSHETDEPSSPYRRPPQRAEHPPTHSPEEPNMDKPRFSLDDLQVQTFETTTSPRHHPAATVRGQTEYPIEETAYNDPNCNPYYTQGSSCQQGGG